MPTPTNPKDKRYAVSFAFGEWQLLAVAMDKIAAGCATNLASAGSAVASQTAHEFTRDTCNRIAAKIRTEVPGLSK